MTVNECFPSWITAGGIFTGLMSASSGRTFPWSTETETTAAVLDYEYHGFFSGNKTASPFLSSLFDSATSAIPTASLEKVCQVIYSRYRKNWEKLYAAFFATYTPINNYDMRETEAAANSDTRTPTNWTTAELESSTDTRTPTDWKITETMNSRASETDIYGFNSATPVGDSKTTDTGSVETEYSGTDTTAHTVSRTVSQTGTDKTDHVINRILTRSGNIGVTSSQQLIEAEIELRRKNFWESVFADIDHMITIPIYEGTEEE